MASSSGHPLKGQRSVTPSEVDAASSSAIPPTSVQSNAVWNFGRNLSDGFRSECAAALENDFDSLTWPGSPLEWLKEPLAMGFTPEEVVELVSEEEQYSPWIPYEIQQRELSQMDPVFHQAGCLHRWKQHEPNPKSMKSLTTEAKRIIAEYCGFGGIDPNERKFRQVQFEDSAAYISYRDPDIEEPGDPEVLHQALKRCLSRLERIIHVCAWLQNHGWVCDRIVIIRYDHHDEIRCEAIHFSHIAQLKECMDEAISRHPVPEDEQNCRIFKAALQLLDMYLDVSTSVRSQLWNAVDLCALAIQMISISFLSICEAHVGALHPFFLDRPIRKICLSGINGPMSQEHKIGFQLQGLACLGLMLGSPIMAFVTNWPSAIQEDSRETLNTSVEDLLELWGPGRLVPEPPGSRHTARAIEIGGGCIYLPVGTSASGNMHWAPGELIDQPPGHYFESHFQLYIAGLLSVNQNCPSRLHHELVPMSVIRQEIHTLGTQQESWSLQQIQAGLQVGQIANATLNGTWLRSASRTKKEHALAEVGLDVLDQSWGLLVSLCTGIARRVALREVIAEVFHQITSAWLDSGEICQLPSEPGFREKMRQSNFRKWLSSQAFDDRKVISRSVKYVLGKLCWTGISPKSKLVAACTSEKQSDGCIHISLEGLPVLATILRDTTRSATFASLTTECVVTDQYKCQSTSHPEWRNDVTALATAVCQYRYTGGGDWEKVSNKGLEHGRLYWMGHMNDNRRLVAEVSGPQGDQVILKVADSQVPWSFYLRAYEKVDRMRAHYIALREQSYVGEEGAQEVLIVSG